MISLTDSGTVREHSVAVGGFVNHVPENACSSDLKLNSLINRASLPLYVLKPDQRNEYLTLWQEKDPTSHAETSDPRIYRLDGNNESDSGLAPITHCVNKIVCIHTSVE